MNVLFAFLLLLPQAPNTIPPIKPIEAFIPTNPLIDVHSVRVVWYRPKDCRMSKDLVRTAGGTKEVRECSRAIFEFGALKATRRAPDADTDWQQPGNDSDATAALQTPRKDTLTVHYQPKRCKPLGDRYDRYVCGSEKGAFGVWFVKNQ